MPILCQTIVDRCLSALDAEGSDRYVWDRDFLPAISNTNEWMVSLFNSVFSAKKLSEESLGELKKIRLWQANMYSGFNFDSLVVGDELWSVLAIYVKNATVPSSPTLPSAISTSVFRSDVRLLDPGKSCKRTTDEKVAEKNRNPFVEGSDIFGCEDLIEYAYVNSTVFGATLAEYPIYPSVAGELIAVSYLAKPTSPINIGDSLNFPETLTDMIVDKTLNYLAYKQGDAPLLSISDRSINHLTVLMT